jgi:CelD/BcsL family acetyltransferase involved in cellulose biosynthesis
LTVTELDTGAQLHALQTDWDALVERAPTATVYQTWEWNDAWWQAFRARKKLRLLLVHDGSDLVGIAPMYVSRHLGTPLLRLAFLGTGVSDYLDLIAAPERAVGVAQAILQHIGSSGKHDLADLQQVPPWSPLAALEPDEADGPAQTRLPEFQTGASASSGAGSVPARLHYAMEVCPHLALPESWEALTAGLGKRMRSNIAYYDRLLRRTFADAETRLVSPDELPSALEALFDLHARRWRSRKLPGVLRGGPTQRFHRDVAARFAARGWLRLHVTEVDGRIVAALYCFAYRGRYYYYLGGFDPAFGRYSIGTTLTAAAIRQAITEGCTEFDFLRGHEPYKYRWMPQERHNLQILLPRTTGVRASAMLRLNRFERYVERKVKAFAEGSGGRDNRKAGSGAQSAEGMGAT